MWSIMVYHDILWSITWYIKWFIMVYITIKWSVIPIMIYCGILWSIMVILRYIYYEDGIDYDLLWLGHIRTCLSTQNCWMPGTMHQCNKMFWNDISQLILWIFLHKGHRYELRPPISAKSLNKKTSIRFINRKALGAKKPIQKHIIYSKTLC